MIDRETIPSLDGSRARSGGELFGVWPVTEYQNGNFARVGLNPGKPVWWAELTGWSTTFASG